MNKIKDEYIWKHTRDYTWEYMRTHIWDIHENTNESEFCTNCATIVIWQAAIYLSLKYFFFSVRSQIYTTFDKLSNASKYT